jgi:protein-disulfide isomerase
MSDSALSHPVGPNDHVQGPDNAPLTLVEYGDYQCSYCGEAYPILKAVKKRMGDELRFVFRNFPITEIHPYAFIAAEAAEAAAAQGKFWQMHDTLYEHQADLSAHALVSYADTVGLDMDRFAREVNKQTYSHRIQADFQSGVKSGVDGTPALFINGQKYEGERSVEAIIYALETAIPQTAR